MKKAITILLALVMILSLAACGGGSAAADTPAPTEATATPKPTLTPEPTPELTPKPIALKDVIIGTWVFYYTQDENNLNGSIGDKMSRTIEFYKGGTGKITFSNEARQDDKSSFSLSWEISDEIVNIEYTVFSAAKKGFEYNYETDTLSSVDGTAVFQRK